MGKKLEEGEVLNLDWKKLKKVVAVKRGLVPVAVQDFETKEVLLVAYVNYEALKRTLESGVAIFWSTSRNRLWTKGETSGSILRIVAVHVNCEQNSLLYFVKRKSGACHTKSQPGSFRRSCFYRRILMDGKEFKLELIRD
jgi:phosphoribosyl-AMP cyclohydrolase